MENPSNRGKGYSVRNGLMHANGEIVMFTDADLSAPIEEAERLFAAIEEEARTSPSARAGSRPAARRIASRSIGKYSAADSTLSPAW